MVSGTLVGAFNLHEFGVAARTVNGVTFAPFAVETTASPGSVTNGNFTLAFAQTQYAHNTGFGSTNSPFTFLSSSYKTLLQSGASDLNTPETSKITLTIGGLSIGSSYLFQWWTNDSGQMLLGGLTTASSGNAISLDANTTDTNGGVGQFALGTFVANASTQVITFTNSSDTPLLNAFQLRAIPEPSTGVILLGGVAFLAARRRRRPTKRQ